MASQDPQSSTLNPGMVYRPASGPRAIDDDDSPVKPVKFPFNAVIFTRALILVFSLTDICLMLSWRYGLRSELVFAIIFTFFCFFWNIIVLLQFLFQAFRKKKDDVSVFSLPRFHLQFGSCNVTCGGDDDDDEGGGDQDSEGRHLLDGGDAPKRSNPLRKNVQRTVDLIHGIALLIGGLVAETNRYWWHVAEPVFVLLLLISSLEFFVIFLSYFKVFGPVTVTVTPNDDDEVQRYRIRLPESRRGTGPDPKLSVVA